MIILRILYKKLTASYIELDDLPIFFGSNKTILTSTQKKTLFINNKRLTVRVLSAKK